MSKEKLIAELFLQMERSNHLGRDPACDDFLENIWELSFGPEVSVEDAENMLKLSGLMLQAHGIK